jgi:putative ABC transport system permease protein
MMVLGLIVKEIIHRKINFLLGVLAVLTATALFVAFTTAEEAFNRETIKIQLGLGQNLRIVPKETSMDDLWSQGFSNYTMPEDNVLRLASLKNSGCAHLTAVLQKKTTWRDMTIILTGISPEVSAADSPKQPPMTFSVEPGTVYLGHELARNLRIAQNDTINILGTSFKVAKCLSAGGTSDDIRIYGHLHDMQKLLQLDGQISEIRALECLCIPPVGSAQLDQPALIQKQVSDVLPGAKVVRLDAIAQIRQKQRAAAEGFGALAVPIVVIACGAWIGILAMMNVQDRRQEIGILRSLGYAWSKIASLLLGRSVIVGLAGAIIGFFAGTALTLSFGPSVFKITAKAIKPEFVLLVWSVVAAPAFSVMSSLIPAILGIAEDPANTLRNE